MKDLPEALRELADRLQKFRPTPIPEVDDGEYLPLDMQVGRVVAVFEERIHDSLQFYKSVEYAAAFRERFKPLYECARSPDPIITRGLVLQAGFVAVYCRRLATAIEGELPADQQASELAAADGAPTPADRVSPNADEIPDDLMYLSVVKKKYHVSQSTLDTHIKDKKLKCWRDKGGHKRIVSQAAVKLLYNAR